MLCARALGLPVGRRGRQVTEEEARHEAADCELCQRGGGRLQ